MRPPPRRIAGKPSAGRESAARRSAARKSPRSKRSVAPTRIGDRRSVGPNLIVATHKPQSLHQLPTVRRARPDTSLMPIAKDARSDYPPARREWDSNPRKSFHPSHAFQACALGQTMRSLPADRDCITGESDWGPQGNLSDKQGRFRSRPRPICLRGRQSRCQVVQPEANPRR